MRGGLTRKQRELLDFLRQYIAANDDMAPSFDEMVTALGLKSKSGIARLVDALEERGFIRRTPNRARCIWINEAPESEFERGRKAGYSEGYRAAVKEFGHRDPPSPSAETPSQTSAFPSPALHSRPVEPTRSPPGLLSREVA